MSNHTEVRDHRSSFWVSILFLGLSIQGCASRGEVVSLDYSLSEIKSSLQSFYNNELVAVDETGREYVSKYFRPNIVQKKPVAPKPDDKVRARSITRIVGNERPYSITTKVEVETYSNKDWTSQGFDKDLSAKISKLLSEFVKARSNKNVIDHFRSF